MWGRLAPLTGIVLGLMGFLVPVASSSGILSPPLAASPVGTAFTYQGQLRQNGVPANGLCDLQLSLFDAATPTTQVGSTQTKSNVGVSNGLFTILDLDFGNVFDGNARWLQIAVRCPAGSGGFTTLSPLIPLTPTPYAIHAASANSATTATTATNFTGTLTGDVTGTQGVTIVSRLQGQTVASTVPTNSQVLQFNGSQWGPATLSIPNPGLSEYAYVYGTRGQAILAGNDVSFEFTGPATAGIVHAAFSSSIVVIRAGTYKIAFTIAPNTQRAFAVVLNGLPVPGGTYEAMSVPLSGHVITQVPANSTIGLRLVDDPVILPGEIFQTSSTRPSSSRS